MLIEAGAGRLMGVECRLALIPGYERCDVIIFWRASRAVCPANTRHGQVACLAREMNTLRKPPAEQSRTS